MEIFIFNAPLISVKIPNWMLIDFVLQINFMLSISGVSDIQDPSLTDPGNYHPGGSGGGSKPTVYSFPMVRESDMGAEMQQEVVELCGIACERHVSNNENAAKAIKEEVSG